MDLDEKANSGRVERNRNCPQELPETKNGAKRKANI